MSELKPGDLCAWSVRVAIRDQDDYDVFPRVMTQQRLGVVTRVSHSAITVRERGGPLRHMELRSVHKVDRIPADEYER